MSAAVSTVTTVIEARGSARAGAAELWRYRELWWTLAVRDLAVRYKQTLLGAGWAVIVPVVSMLVMNVFFGHVMGMADRVGAVAYPIFLFAGNLPWVLFANTVNASSNSLVSNSHILSKVYFPRLVLPLSAAVGPAADYLIAFSVLVGMMWWFNVAVTWRLAMLVPLLILLMAAGIGMGIALSAVMVAYRDVRHAVPFLLQVLFFATPVIYPAAMVGSRHQWLVHLNPLAGVIEAMRAAVLSSPMNWSGLATSGGVSVALLAVSVRWFAVTERTFADVI